MDIYNAIMKAADHIGGNPHEFWFASTSLPDEPHCGTAGCALGWIGAFAGYKSERQSFGAVAREVLKVPCNPLSDGDEIFYDRMYELGGNNEWQEHAQECARVLRLYAAKYHAESIPPIIPRTGLPDIVRAIFQQRATV